MLKSKFLVLALVLAIAWLGAFFVLHLAGFLLRAMVVLAVVFLILHFLARGKKQRG